MSGDHDNIPIAALGRLNAHARAGSDRGLCDTIYTYKLLAALLLAIDGAASVRFVRWSGPCGRCMNGRFTHWDWDAGVSVPCRYCRGTSRVTLRFTETTLADGQVWHHPWEGFSLPGLEIARAVGVSMDPAGIYRGGDGAALAWAEAGTWSPRQPGTKLELAHLVPLLNRVEDWVEAMPPLSGFAHWPARNAKRRLWQNTHAGVISFEPSHAYHLDLGRAPGGCFVCGGAELAGIAYARWTPLLHWSLPVCKRHGDGPEKAAHPPRETPPPAALITPDIQRWLDRHSRVTEAA